MVHPYANPAGYMSASRDTLSSQGYGPKRGEDCRPPRRKRFSALSFMNMVRPVLILPPYVPSHFTTLLQRNSKDLSPTSTIVTPSPARSRAPSVSRSRAPSVSHSRGPSAPSAILSTPQPILSTPQPIALTPQPIASTPPSIVRKPSSGSRRGRDPPFIVKSSQHCTFEVALPAETRVALPAKTRDGGVHSRTARSVPRATVRHEQLRSRYEQSRTTRSVPSRIARVPPPSITQAPSTTRPSPPSTARPSPPSTARSSPPSTARSTTEYGSSTAIYSSPSTARSSPTLVSTPVLTSRVVNASTPNLAPHLSAAAQHSAGNIAPAHSAGSLGPHSAGNAAASRSAGNAAYPDDTWSFFTPPTPAVPRFSFNWNGQPGRRGRMRLYGAQIKHYGVRFRHYGVRVKHSMRGARARQMKGKVITTYGKTKAKGKVLERQIAVRDAHSFRSLFPGRRSIELISE
ncbi:hypothetical protein EV715DRAFT_202214 [Schizophyllum commune]